VMEDRQESSEPTKTEPETKDRPSLLTQQLNEISEPTVAEPEPLSPHADDKPAPLFAGKNRESNAESAKIDTSRFTVAAPELDPSEVTPIDETASVRSVVFGSVEGQADAQFEVDIDGTPVVGDLLKITFVENKVVPTILVSCSLPVRSHC
jgi:SIT4-associating protein SAP185/190